MENSSSARAGVALLLLFGLFWNGLIGVFDVMIVRQKLAEHRARTQFEQVPVRILSSTVTSSTDSDGGTTYRPVILYEYDFDGGRYTSDRYAYSQWGTSERGYADQVVSQHPANSEAVALVDPTDPREAVLDASGRAFPSLIYIFLTPFHCIGIGILAGCLTGFRRRKWTPDEINRAKFVLIDDDERFVLRQPPTHCAAVFLATLGVSSFIAIFAMGFTLGMMGAGRYAVPVWLLLVGVSGWTMLWSKKRSRAPENFLHVDRGQGLFSFPADALGERLDSIERLEVRSTPTKVSVNDVPVMEHVFEVALEGGLHQEVFRHRGSPDDGRVIHALLEEALSLPPADRGRLEAA